MVPFSEFAKLCDLSSCFGRKGKKLQNVRAELLFTSLNLLYRHPVIAIAVAIVFKVPLD